MNERIIATEEHSTAAEHANRNQLLRLFRNSPIPERELLSNLALFTNRQTLARILFLHDLYRRILTVHGVVMEFGVRWGRNLALFESLRGMYEPFNYTRKIIGFDTFAGFPGVGKEDRMSDKVLAGGYAVTENYETFLDAVLTCHEEESPISHLRKYELIKGDATVEVDRYLQANPQTIIAFAWFDMDLYAPTKQVLETIRPYLTRGSVLGFDELNHVDFPGETQAVRDVLGLDRYRIERSPLTPSQAFMVIE